MPEITRPLRFAADATLGKLVKHLRLAGFDTLLDPHRPQADRLARLARDERTILTRSQSVRKTLSGLPLIFIQANDPPDQFRQLILILGLRWTDLHPLTRCALCNGDLVHLPKSEAFGKVPEFVWQQHSEYQTCIRCRRIYWAGSHAQRWRRQITTWFEREG